MNQEHLKNLNKGKIYWNTWREDHPEIWPDLTRAELTDMTPRLRYPLKRRDFRGFNFSHTYLGMTDLRAVDLSKANLSFAKLNGANLSEGILSEANLQQANLEDANLTKTVLFGANLSGIYTSLVGADLTSADCRNARFCQARLAITNLHKANFSNADLRESNLNGARLIETVFKDADLSGSSVWGVSAWDLDLEGATQSELIITPKDAPRITVDDLEIAQFLYLLLNNQKLRYVIDNITTRTVLILGRFTPERKQILDEIRGALRRNNLIPLMFDFARPSDRDFTETVLTLAGLCRFVIADITNPSSSPLELQAIVPNFMIPVVPILQEGESPFAMFRDLENKHTWVLDIIEYDSAENLVKVLDWSLAKIDCN
ncbi:MAG: pentapeptide repeat-containing protein [Cyanobacteria bacterium P01_F01_bin.53]